jgi:hypothetical protein
MRGSALEFARCSRMTGNTETIHVACSFRSDFVTTRPDYIRIADKPEVNGEMRVSITYPSRRGNGMPDPRWTSAWALNGAAAI